MKHDNEPAAKTKRTGLMWQWFLSYTSILLMPILICSFYYFHSYNLLEQRTLSNQHLILENSKEQMDSAFYDAINLSNHLQLNNYINMLSQGKCAIDSTPNLDRHYLRNDLKMLQVSNSLIQQINVYFPLSGYIVSATSSYEMEMLPYMQNMGINVRDWTEILKESKTSSVKCITSEDSSCLILSTILQTDAYGSPLAVMAVQLDKDRMIHRLQNDLLPGFEGIFALIDEERILLSSNADTSMFEDLPFSSIIHFFEEKGEDALYDTSSTATAGSYMIDYYPTIIPSIGLISIIDKSVYKADLYRLLEVLFFTLILCVLAGLLVIFYFSRKNYEPVAQIVHYIKGYGEQEETDKNEYHLIMKFLTNNQSELERQRNLLRNNYVQKILTGEIAFHQISGPIAESFSLHFSSGHVCIILLSLETSEKDPASSNIAVTDNAEPLVYFIIENVLKEMLSQSFPDSYFCIQHRQVAVIVCIPEEEASPEELLSSVVRDFFVFLVQNYQLELKAGLSAVVPNEKLSTAYLQADTALEYIKLFGNSNFCHFSDLPREQEIGAVHLHTNEYVINLVLSDDQTALREYFCNLRNELDNIRLSSADARSCYYFFYLATSKLRLFCQTHYGFIPSSLDFIEDSFFQSSLPSVLTKTQEAYQTAAEQLQEKKDLLDNNRWGTDIRRFIQNNYFDMDLNLNTLAAHFKVSPSYLSKKYKEQYQSSVIDYLYEIRIQHSIALIQDTNMKITEIAQMVGFADSNAFIRIFKKISGTTPGKYKASLLTGRRE